MSDRLSVRIYPVRATPVSGIAQQKVLARLDLMERELKHLRTAIIDMRNAVRSGRPGASLASAVMNSRNWLLSVLMSHTYVQDMLRGDGSGASGGSLPALQLDVLTPRAIRAGLEDAKRDRG